MILSLSSCGKSKPQTPIYSATFIAEIATITIFPPLALPQSPTLASTHYPTLPFTKDPTITSTPTPTITNQPTASRTITLTPVPTVIPSITPTFDAYYLATATRSLAEVCPQKNADVNPPDFEALTNSDHLQQYYLDYFNSGGIAGALPTYWQPEFVVDLTNDGVPEYVIKWFDVFILGCHSGKYQLLLDIRSGGSNEVLEIKDANLNGMPEIILRVKLTPYIENFNVVEWDGTSFRSLFIPNDRHIIDDNVFEPYKGIADLKFADLDSDPVFELAIILYLPYAILNESYPEGYPWRKEIDYYKWNGNNYVFFTQKYDPPLFRFQAVHDGDWAFLRGEYDEAIDFYQQAIKDDNLYWYTEERRYYLFVNDQPSIFPKVTPEKPVYDPVEYPTLAAYSYFRMMLAEIKKDRLARAQTTYDWLQGHFTAGMPGHVYAELATLFWNEYKKSQDFALSCSLTYDFASTHPEEVFRYLTTQIVINKKLITWPDPIHFGAQSAELEYSPAMICPSQ